MYAYALTLTAVFEMVDFMSTCPLSKREDTEGKKCRFRAG